MVVLLTTALVIGSLIVLVVIIRDDEGAPAPPPTTAAPSPSLPSATTTEPPTPEEAAIASAEAVYRDYLRVSADVTTAGDGDAAAFEAVAVGEALTQAQLAAENYRVAGITQVGRPEVASLEAQSVNLQTADGLVPEVLLDVCLDVTGFDLVQDGESVLDPNAPDRARSEVTIRNYPDRGGWLVARIAAEGAAC